VNLRLLRRRRSGPLSVARSAFAVVAIALGLVAAPADAQVSYRLRITDNNLVGLSTTNYGFFGNNFTSRAASFEYPLGTGYEHMVRGGYWIGGLTQFSGTGEELRVTTAAVDGSQGSVSASGTEFTPAGNQIIERSKLPNSPTYSPLAVSEQDFVTEYVDFPIKSSVTGGEDHAPLGIRLEQKSYNWSFSRFANFVAVTLKITNTGPPLRNAWVGIYSELASGPKFAYSGWPPSSAGGGTLGGWYNKKLMGYVPEARLLTEHYCRSASSLPGSCAADVCPPYVGIKLLGIRPDTVSTKQVTMYLANYEPGDTTRDEDSERFNILSTGRITPPDSLLPGFSADGASPNDPVSLLAVGPFDELLPDSSITVDFAFVGGNDAADLLANAAFAQLAFDFNYVIPEPPASPRMAIVPSDGALEVYWDHSSEFDSDPTSPAPDGLDFEGYRVYVGRENEALARVGQYDLRDTTGFDTGLEAVALADSVQIDGSWYHYRQRVTGLKTGFKYQVAVTAFDTGDDQIESLESGVTQNLSQAVPAPSPAEAVSRRVTVFPNPYKVEAQWDTGALVRDHYLWFANLPQRCTIRIYTLAGDLVKSFAFDGATYDGANARGLYDPAADAATGAPSLSGSLFAWDMITDQGQAAASGLYLYAVEDASSGAVQRGKFLVLKSDREGFK
jgi:hypothetical protein